MKIGNKKAEDGIDCQISPINTIKDFLSNLQITINDISDEDLNRYTQAFTHGSFQNGEESYERLEFLGDRILNMVVAGYLYEKKEKLSQGEMTRKLECVSNDNLQKVITENSLFPEQIIRTNDGKLPSLKIYADVFEALIGAIYLHQGFERAKDIVLKFFKEEIEEFNPDQNYKGRLQEKFQKGEVPFPDYSTIKKGPANKPTFYCSVKVGNVIGKGTDGKKITAEKIAARNVLEKLG